jgi:hypothetical protein
MSHSFEGTKMLLHCVIEITELFATTFLKARSLHYHTNMFLMNEARFIIPAFYSFCVVVSGP